MAKQSINYLLVTLIFLMSLQSRATNQCEVLFNYRPQLVLAASRSQLEIDTQNILIPKDSYEAAQADAEKVLRNPRLKMAIIKAMNEFPQKNDSSMDSNLRQSILTYNLRFLMRIDSTAATELFLSYFNIGIKNIFQTENLKRLQQIRKDFASYTSHIFALDPIQPNILLKLIDLLLTNKDISKTTQFDYSFLYHLNRQVSHLRHTSSNLVNPIFIDKIAEFYTDTLHKALTEIESYPNIVNIENSRAPYKHSVNWAYAIEYSFQMLKLAHAINDTTMSAQFKQLIEHLHRPVLVDIYSRELSSELKNYLRDLPKPTNLEPQNTTGIVESNG